MLNSIVSTLIINNLWEPPLLLLDTLYIITETTIKLCRLACSEDYLAVKTLQFHKQNCLLYPCNIFTKKTINNKLIIGQLEPSVLQMLQKITIRVRPKISMFSQVYKTYTFG